MPPRFLKRVAALTPLSFQQELKRLHFARQIRAQRFVTEEPEFRRLREWLGAGDWAIDIGANIGHYTLSMAAIVGNQGRVVALEPVPETFALLAANVMAAGRRNVTLLNAAASSACASVGMAIPRFDSGLANNYMASVTNADGAFAVLAVRVDAMPLPARVRLVKLDVEGHELEALRGLEGLINRDRPVLIVEGEDPKVAELLRGHGYGFARDVQSPNRVYSATVG